MKNNLILIGLGLVILVGGIWLLQIQSPARTEPRRDGPSVSDEADIREGMADDTTEVPSEDSTQSDSTEGESMEEGSGSSLKVEPVMPDFSVQTDSGTDSGVSSGWDLESTRE